ncbi:hypothetical protein KBP53_06040 [Corynebacterium genitalium ATCC 33030]|uniref:Uncharacterized protein n=1 Tax=Corynebacterium genitalium ATCC 33030 TaxID=585529 RepID=D7WCS0_9CORY|nr:MULTISPECIES: hypothetical protein [Corynebacterium]MCQ4618817.1 hypothetical protein [Corynebacterium pseudogenitalium]EFK53951.1 hypothetical protein HMPREF0291_11608 [Corynebacterium genitalium ATCC 33030]MCQ4620492.1 hypothetical protein [Corynebacterium sp. CCUG 71335]MCQ4624768.1 hypothetical protein [Corynebacterium sp. CCUG 69979]UUA88505.1 hypothetical protein KBP53_06040 [Corynebacterium genitalium ATCC 33030]
MTIRDQFQSDVDEFIDDLTTFATGSYLQDSDKELWEEPFDPAVLPDLKELIEKYLDALEIIGDDPDGEKLNSVVEPFFAKLDEFNAKHAEAVLEPEEKSDLQDLAYRAAAATGADDEALNSLPELD